MPLAKTLHRVSFALVASLLLALPGTAVAQEEPASPSPSAAPVEATPSGSWLVVAYDPWEAGLVEPRKSGSLTVGLLSDGRLEGQTGCGRYSGGYSVDDDRIGLGIISRAFGDCGAKAREEDVAFSVALDAVTHWRPTDDGSGLELLDDAGRVRVILGRGIEAGPEGDWLVTTYTRANGKPAEPLPESPMRLGLGAEGSATGSTGCRLFEGQYRAEGDGITIGPIEPIGLPCKGPDRKPERRLLNALGDVVTWRRSGSRLILTDAFEQPLVKLLAAPAVVAPSPGPSASPAASPSLPPLEADA